MADDREQNEANPQAAKPQQGIKHPQPARGTRAGTTVTWEEQRKGMAPRTTERVDETFYDERFTSERQRVDRASSGWKVIEPEGAAEAPNWPPPLRR